MTRILRQSAGPARVRTSGNCPAAGDGVAGASLTRVNAWRERMMDETDALSLMKKHNYRRVLERCGKCKRSKPYMLDSLWCNLLNMRVNRDYTCDAWERKAGTNGQD